MKLCLRWLVLIGLFSGLAAQATVMPIRFYHMGEDDPGVGHTVVVTNSFDSASTNALTITGAPQYWATAASSNTNSSYSMMFSVGDEATAAVVTNTDNVCLEAWADTGWRVSHVVAYNGDSSTNGYGFILSNTNYLAVLGGVGIAATIPCPPGSWMHLAMVCSNGVVAVYTNGSLAAVTNAVPNPPTGNLFIGGPNVGTVGNDGTYPYNFVHGFVDDVRISTFAPGGFHPADLLYRAPVGTPLSVSLSGGNIVVGVPAGKTLARLQTTTSLASPNWQSADAPEVLATQQTRTDPIQGPAMFYRLNPAAGSPVPAIMIDGNQLVVSQGVPTVTEWDGLPSYEVSPGLDGTSLNLLDISPSVDLLSDSTNTLSCHWQVFEPMELGGNLFTNHPDYNSLTLYLEPSAWPALQDTGGNSTFWRVEVFVRHIPYTSDVVPAQQSIYWFYIQYVSSQMVLSSTDTGNPPLYSEWNQ